MPNAALRFAAAVLLLGTTLPASAQTTAEWREDLAFFSAQMESRHKNLYHTTDAATFKRSVDALDAKLPDLERHQIIVELMRIAASVGDGHTNVSPHRDAKVAFRSLPVRFYAFDDGLFIRAARSEHASLVGARVEAIGGIPVLDARTRVLDIIARDNAMGAETFVPIYLGMPEILHALGLAKSPDEIELTLRIDSRTSTVKLAAMPPDEPYPPDTDVSLETTKGWVDAASEKRPLWLADLRTLHRLTYLAAPRVVYAQLNKVGDMPEQSLATFGEAIRKRAAAENAKAIVLDLRLNRGGNGALVPAFIRPLIQANDEDTALYVLIGRSSFSATQFLADDLDRYSNAILVGEPTGSKPNAFGDSFKIVLPNSGVTARASIYWWQENQEHDDSWTAPDIAAPLAFPDYAAGRDPALAVAIAGRTPELLTAVLLDASRAPGVAGLRAALAAYEDRPANRYVDMERPMLRSALSLQAAKRTDEALDLLELTTTRFPDSAISHTIRAQVAEVAGETALGRHSAQRALELDKNQRDAMEIVKRLSR